LSAFGSRLQWLRVSRAGSRCFTQSCRNCSAWRGSSVCSPPSTTNAMLVDDAQRKCSVTTPISRRKFGRPRSHNRMRRSSPAFERKCPSGVARLSPRVGVPVSGSNLHSCTYRNSDTTWIGDRVRIPQIRSRQGAALLQVSSLVGRWGRGLPTIFFRSSGCAPLMLLELALCVRGVARLQTKNMSPSQRFNTKTRRLWGERVIPPNNPDRGFAIHLAPPAARRRGKRPARCDLLAPVVMEADGTVVPLQYQFLAHIQLGNIHSAELSEEFPRWSSTTSFPVSRPPPPRLGRGVYDRLFEEPGAAAKSLSSTGTVRCCQAIHAFAENP